MVNITLHNIMPTSTCKRNYCEQVQPHKGATVAGNSLYKQIYEKNKMLSMLKTIKMY